jgi:hypothetical protein
MRAYKRKINAPMADRRLHTLADMLTYCRPADSETEALFCYNYIANLPGVTLDAYGNYHVTIGTSPIVWSCHTDTVHRRDGRQKLWITPNAIGLHPHEKANCLGADDTVGVWIMREMILAGIPGHYVFHYAEEIGGIGSRNVTRESPELFKDARFCIALDRQGTTDVITHQAGDRCCSDAFAQSLAAQLASVADYKPCDRGVYTDSAEYTGIIGECTNLSVGYYRQHSANEYCSPGHAVALLDALSRLDANALVSERMPGDSEWDDDLDGDDWHYTWAKSTRDSADSDRPWLSWGMSRGDWEALSDDDRTFARYLMGEDN